MITFKQLLEFTDAKKKTSVMPKEKSKESMVYGILLDDDYSDVKNLKTELQKDAFTVIRRFHPFFTSTSLKLNKISVDIPGSVYMVWYDIPDKHRNEVIEVFRRNGEGVPWFAPTKELYRIKSL